MFCVCMAFLIVFCFFFFFFFKQKTAYEMRISDWSSDVCSSDLIGDEEVPVDVLVADPVQAAQDIQPLGAPHDRIPLPRDLYRNADGRPNSAGIDLSNEQIGRASCRERVCQYV